MSGNPSDHSGHRARNHTVVRLGSLGLARNPAGNLVYLADRQTEVSAEEIEQSVRLLREGYYPSHGHAAGRIPVPQRHAWGSQLTPSQPPGLGPATSDNSRQLRFLIPEAEQFWPAEFRQFDRRYAGALLAPPSITVTSAGGPIRRPAPTPGPATGASSQESGRTSRGVHVQLGGYFTADQLRSSKVTFSVQTMEGGSTGQQGPSSASAGNTLPPIPPRGSVLHRPQPSASAPAFVPRAAAPEFLPRAATLAAQPAIQTPGTASATSVAATTAPSWSFSTTASKPVPVVNLPRPSVSMASKPAITSESPNDDSRMVVLRGIPEWMSVANMADSVSSGLYGALFAIEFAVDNGKHSARVIFRDEETVGVNPAATPGAKGYYDALTAAKVQPWADRGRALWPFPPGCTIEFRLENFPANDWIRGMRPRLDADGKRIQAVSRRLSLVGLEQLFNSFREKDMRSVIVGGGTVCAASIERVCVCNSGNATIVFADVPSAVQALKRFEEYNASAAKETLKVKASHSKDPCEVTVQYSPNDLFGSQPAHPRPGPKGYFNGKREGRP